MINIVNIFFGNEAYVCFDAVQGLHIVDMHTGD